MLTGPRIINLRKDGRCANVWLIERRYADRLGEGPLFLLLQFTQYPGRCAKLLVIAKGLLAAYVELLQQSHPSVESKSHVRGEPDFLVNSGLLQHKSGAFMDPRQDPTYGNSVDGLHVELCHLQIGLVDPHSAVKFAEKLRLFHVRFESGARFASKHPGFASSKQFRPQQCEFIRVSNLTHELAVVVALL